MVKAGRKNKVYSAEVKISVIIDMQEHHLCYNEVVRKYWDITQFKVCDTKVYLSPVLDLFSREIVSYSISLSPTLQQIRNMLQGLFNKLSDEALAIFHSDQG